MLSEVQGEMADIPHLGCFCIYGSWFHCRTLCCHALGHRSRSRLDQSFAQLAIVQVASHESALYSSVRVQACRFSKLSSLISKECQASSSHNSYDYKCKIKIFQYSALSSGFKVKFDGSQLCMTFIGILKQVFQCYNTTKLNHYLKTYLTPWGWIGCFMISCKFSAN